MAKPFFRNPEVFNLGVDIQLKRVESTLVAVYREIVWDIFVRILNQTPQFTGRAVANWNIGVGAPDYDYDDTLGDTVQPISFGSPGRVAANERGDRKWIERAKVRNRPKMPLIQRSTKVFINNGIVGDDDDGRSSEMYLESLQDPGYWAVKLRYTNKPYETAQESVIHVAERAGRLRGEFIKAGGNNMAMYP